MSFGLLCKLIIQVLKKEVNRFFRTGLRMGENEMYSFWVS